MLGQRPYFIYLVSLLFLISHLGHASENIGNASAVSSEDRMLRAAFYEEKFENFADQIKLGADPTRWFENSWDGWVFCVATDKGREEYLELIVESGADVNFRQVDIIPDISTPLLCSIRYRNLKAVKYLIRNGADPYARVCLECEYRIATSALWVAALNGSYDISIWLMENSNFSFEQLKAVATFIETAPYANDMPQPENRERLISLLRENGLVVNPWSEDGAK